MIGILNLFLPLVILVLILYALSRTVDGLVLRRLGRGWYLVTMWPGVVVHELSHFVGCLITFTKVYKVRLFYPSGSSLGFVQHERVHNPITKIVISIAPLFGGTAVIWLLTKWLWPDLYAMQLTSLHQAVSDVTSWDTFFSITSYYANQFWMYIKDLVLQFDFTRWQTYVFIYAMLSLSSHAAPSKEDLKHTYWGIGGLAVIFTFLYILDQWLQASITWTIIQWLTKPISLAAAFLAYGVIFAALSVVLLFIMSLVIRLFKR